MGNCGSMFFIAISVSVVALCIGKTPDEYPAAVFKAWLFDMLPLIVQDAYVGFTLANIIWLACVIHEWIKAAGLQLFIRISVFADHGSEFLDFFGATIYSWFLLQKLCVEIAVVRASSVIDDAKTVLIEIIDTLTQLHSRLEVTFSATLAHCVTWFLVVAVLLLLFKISPMVTTALHSVVNKICHLGRRVHWRGTFLLSVASVLGYVGYLWTNVV